MKYILILLLSFSTIFSFSQAPDQINGTTTGPFPSYFIDTSGHKAGVVLTIEQAQRVDNDYDLLELLEKQQLGCDTTIKTYQILVKHQDELVAALNLDVSQKDSLLRGKDALIEELKGQIKVYIHDAILCGTLVDNKDEEIKMLKKQVFKLKVQKIVGFTGVAVFGGVAVGLGVYSIYKSIVH